LDALKDAKPGDSINLTYLWQAYGEAFEEAIADTDLSE